MPTAPVPAATVSGGDSAAPTTSSTASDPAAVAEVEPTPQTEASAAIATDPAEVLPANLAVGALPAGEPFAVAGDGTYRVVGGAGAQAGTSPTVVTYTVEVENGFTPAEGDEAFAQFVDRTLADPRSWTPVKGVSLQRIDAPDARIAATAMAYGCRVWWLERGGHTKEVSVFGFGDDCRRVVAVARMLVTDALAQAAMYTSGRAADTFSFRRSFLMGFGTEIHRRFSEAAEIAA
jgi:hypothetical protein